MSLTFGGIPLLTTCGIVFGTILEIKIKQYKYIVNIVYSMKVVSVFCKVSKTDNCKFNTFIAEIFDR